MSARLLSLCAALALLAPQGARRELTVAAASDLQFVFPELAAAFEQRAGQKIRVTFGSSGQFFAQIENGAPYDMLFSADVDYPGRLAAAGLAEPGTLYRYAVGRIVVWSPRESGADPAALDIRALARPAVRKIAIANPKHAPYGRAAVAALKHYGIYEAVADRLVLGESVSQAAQFVESRSADAGIIANSLALSPRMAARGRCREIPASAHPPIEQAVIILKSSQRKAAALAFLEYLRSPEAAEKWRRWGFARPAQEPEKR